mmetsp:Transcript_27177/g.69015  ORF Transcript_27177/g.69015 Transcript_27177/m.69015 type:complete len:234 (-) Transcript_27177:737-1438(-)
MRVGQVLQHEFDALVDPCLLLDVLHDLRHRHDAGAHLLPRAAGFTQCSPHDLEEHGHEDIFQLLLLGALLREPIQVLLADLYGVIIQLLVVVLVCLASPIGDILLHVEHPLDVEGQDHLQVALPLRLAEVLGKGNGEGHERLHGTVPDILVGRVRASKLQEQGPQLLQAVLLEELGFLVSSRDQGLQHLLEELFVLRVAAKILDDCKDPFHGRDQHLRHLRLKVLNHLQDELR